ncbi:MAG: hypothetical protein ACREJ3_03460, partial [Polyangiaceae bacterium]
MKNPGVGLADAEDISEKMTAVASSQPAAPSRESRRAAPQGEDIVARHLSFRRALLAATVIWTVFFVLDVVVVRYLGGGPLVHFAILRAVVMVVAILVLIRMYRSPVPSERMIAAADLLTYT